MELNRKLCASRREFLDEPSGRAERSQQSWQDDSLGMLPPYLVLSFYNFHERSEFSSILTSYFTSETSII